MIIIAQTWKAGGGAGSSNTDGTINTGYLLLLIQQQEFQYLLTQVMVLTQEQQWDMD